MNNTDLKQISKLLDDRLDSKFDEKLAPIQETLSGHGKILESHGKMLKSHGKMLKSHGKILESHGKMLKSHGKILRSLKKDQSMMLEMLDGEQMKQRKRITKIEGHLGFTSSAA
jgi:hypothetical protein